MNIRTIIGFSSRKANTGPAHGAALGEDEVAFVKQQLGFDPEVKFQVPAKVYDYFDGLKEKGAKAEREWDETMKRYATKYPGEYKELERRRSGKFAEAGWQDLLPTKDKLPQAAQPTRKSSGIAVQAFVPQYNSFMAGSADLLESTFVNFDGQVEFQNVSKVSLTRAAPAKANLVFLILCSPLLASVTIPVARSDTEFENSPWWDWATECLLTAKACLSREFLSHTSSIDSCRFTDCPSPG